MRLVFVGADWSCFGSHSLTQVYLGTHSCAPKPDHVPSSLPLAVFCDYYNPPDECEWHYEPCGNRSFETCRTLNGIHSNISVSYLEGEQAGPSREVAAKGQAPVRLRTTTSLGRHMGILRGAKGLSGLAQGTRLISSPPV